MREVGYEVRWTGHEVDRKGKGREREVGVVGGIGRNGVSSTAPGRMMVDEDEERGLGGSASLSLLLSFPLSIRRRVSF